MRLRVGSQTADSQVAVGGKRNPTFGDEMAFEIGAGVPREMDIEVWFKQPSGSDMRVAAKREGYMTWVGAGMFSGDVQLQDATRAAAGFVTLAAVFEKSVAAEGAGGGGGAASAATPAAEAPRDPSGRFTDAEIKDAFLSFDLDKNTFIGAAEIRHVLANIGESVSDQEVDEMIRMVDKDGDGQVSFAEFYAMVTGGSAPPPGLWEGAGGGVAAPRAGPVGAGPAGGAAQIQARAQRSEALDEFARQFGIKPETIKAAYKRFQENDADGSGLIEYGEFCHILGMDPSPAVERLFALFDKDKSGHLDMREFLIGLSNFTGASKEEKLKFAFAIFDADGNGAITQDELQKILMANHLASKPEEVRRKAEVILRQADRDGNGVITFDEFCLVAARFPNIISPAYSLGRKLHSVTGS